MKRVLISQLVVLVLVIAGTGCAQDPAVEQAAADAANEVVATFAGGQITAGELEGLAGAAVIKLKQQIYEAKAQSLERAIFERLITAEAAKLGISNEEYIVMIRFHQR